MRCTCCGSEFTIKDNGNYSSIKCKNRIIIYYYNECNSVEISRKEFIPGYRNEKPGAFAHAGKVMFDAIK